MMTTTAVLRWLRRNLLGLGMALLTAGVLIWFSDRQADLAGERARRGQQAEDTRVRLERLATDIAAQTTLLVECTGPDLETPCRRRGTETTARAVGTITVEADCRVRRALADLPPPDPARSCTEQTPPDVWPPEASPPRD